MQAGHPRPGAIVPSQVVVSGRTPQAVAEAAQRARRAGAMTYKLKVALGRGGDPSLDVERVAALREAAGGAARLRLDANEGWREEQAQRAFERLADFGIDYVEQPVARSALDAMARLSDAGVVAVAADEALQGSGWQACLDRRAASVWILKPAALGGLRISVALAERARAEGLRTVWSTLLDGAVGRAAAAALAGALGAPGEVHGLGTASWLARDLCDDDGSEQAHQVRLRSGAGLGFTPRSEGSDLFEDHSIFETEAFTGGG
jgi:L-alanine-DL-glutamate epimerase-like enolase superfamily enzyme